MVKPERCSATVSNGVKKVPNDGRVTSIDGARLKSFC
jgi:hypothetical protein